MLLILSGALIFPSSMLTSKWRMCYEWIHLEVKHFFARSAWYCSKRHHIYRYTNVNSCTKLHTLFILSKIVVCESLAVATNPIPHPYSYLLLWNTLRIFYFNPTLPWLMIFLKPILECYMYLNQIIANGAGICQNIIKCYLQYFHIHRPSLYDKK